MRDEEDEEQEAAGRGIKGLRARIDGFTPAKQRKFLKWLGRTGCVRDAAAKAGISTTTIDRTRRKFADFDARCVAALALALPALEAIAYKRATVGAPAKVMRKGKVVEIRVQPSDAMLKLLLTGAAPRKYGSRAGRKRTTPDAARRGRATPRQLPSAESAVESIVARVEAIKRHKVRHKGYSWGPEGTVVPPGWRMVREEELLRLGWTAPAETEVPDGAAAPGAEGAQGPLQSGEPAG